MPLLALVDDRAASWLVDAADDLHQRGLAGAVFTADRVNLAAMQVETDVRQRPYAGKFLGDGLEAKERGLRGGSGAAACRSEEHTSELQSLMRISYAVFCLN